MAVYSNPIPVTIEVTEDGILLRGIYWEVPRILDNFAWELTFMVTTIVFPGAETIRVGDWFRINSVDWLLEKVDSVI